MDLRLFLSLGIVDVSIIVLFLLKHIWVVAVKFGGNCVRCKVVFKRQSVGEMALLYIIS